MKYPLQGSIKDRHSDFTAGKWYECIEPALPDSKFFTKGKVYLCCKEPAGSMDHAPVYLVDNIGELVNIRSLGGKFTEAS